MKKLSFNRKSVLTYIVIIPLIWILGWLIVFPALNSVMTAFGINTGGFTLNYFQEFFASSKNMTALRNTLVLAISTVFICGALGTFFAFITTRFRFFGRGLYEIILFIPMMVPGVLFTIAFMQIYGGTGFIPQALKLLYDLPKAPSILKGFWGILFVHATTQYMFFYVMVSSALKKIDSSVYEAARSLGAGKLKMFTSITLPLLTPALVGAAVLTFMGAVGSFAAPNLIGGNYIVMSVQILMTKTNGFYNMVAVQGLMLAVMSITFLSIMRFYETRRNYIMDVKGKPLQPIVIKGFWKNFGMFSVLFIFLSIIVLPIISIVVLSFVPANSLLVDIFPKTFDLSNYMAFFNNKRALKPFINSLTMALMGTGIATVLAVFSSYIIVKTKLKIRFLIDLVVMLPWALPASTIAVNMIMAFNQPTPFALNQVLVGTSLMLPLTYAITRVTLITRSTSATLSQLHNSVEEASRSLGANWLQTFTKVIIPIIAPGILAGAMLSFVALIGEYTISVLMYTIATQPISVAMTSAMNNFNVGLAMVYGVILISITITIITISKKINKVGDFTF